MLWGKDLRCTTVCRITRTVQHFVACTTLPYRMIVSTLYHRESKKHYSLLARKANIGSAHWSLMALRRGRRAILQKMVSYAMLAAGRHARSTSAGNSSINNGPADLKTCPKCSYIWPTGKRPKQKL